MILDLRTLGELPAQVELEEDAHLLKLNIADVTAVGTVQVRFDIISGDNLYYCRGRAECDVTMECSRCLSSFTTRLDGEVDFTLLKSGATVGEIEGDSRPENLVTAMVSEFEIKIDDPIREALSLEVPLKSLCAQDCRGLCSQCGVDRNRTECDCKQEEIDPRWDDLRKLGNSNQA